MCGTQDSIDLLDAKVASIQRPWMRREQENLALLKRLAALPGRQIPSQIIVFQSLSHKDSVDRNVKIFATNRVAFEPGNLLEERPSGTNIATPFEPLLFLP